MADLLVALTNVEERYLTQLEYALAFVSEDVRGHRIDGEAKMLHVTLAPHADRSAVEQKILQLIERYQNSEFGFKASQYFVQETEVIGCNAWPELLERRWVTEVGDGHVVVRGEAAALMDMIDRSVLRDFAGPFGAELECYPATILCRTLDRCSHFTSFPEHIDFVAHLRPDVEVLSQFAGNCERSGWSPDLHVGQMADHDFAISPSCCYHCYEGMAGWDLPPPGRCVTAVLGCHRYEGSNQQSLKRLRAFNMREVIWVGHPKFVIESRAKADELVIQQARRWGLNCRYETANDMFFTDNYAVRASFQRQQEAKKELRVLLPQEDNRISVISSNFHATTFGKAFGITVGGRPAASACLGWGLERIVYAIYSQFGFEHANWPAGLRTELAAYGREHREGG
jgi:seryl-tRNA synthetase